jgi:hypothetical protein
VKPRLHSVPETPIAEPAPDMSYEAAQRRHIASRDWAKVHVTADRRALISLADRIKGLWR